METKEKLNKLTSRLHKIRQKLRALPQKREELETVFNELKSQWPERLGKWSIGELDEAELDEARRELALTDRNRREISELQVGLEKMERQVLAEMRPLQKKLRLEQAKARYSELYEKLKTNGYDKRLAEKLRVTAHEINRGEECNELLRQLEYQRDRVMTFDQIYGLKPQTEGVNDAI